MLESADDTRLLLVMVKSMVSQVSNLSTSCSPYTSPTDDAGGYIYIVYRRWARKVDEEEEG
jgi:hypothetical protein